MKWVLLCMFAAVLIAQPPAAADPRSPAEIKAAQQIARLHSVRTQWCLEHRDASTAALLLRKGLTDLLKAAEASKQTELSARLLLHTTAADPCDEHAAAWHTAREQLGLRDAFLLQSPAHELVAWVSLPPTWKRMRKDVPVLVVVEGAC